MSFLSVFILVTYVASGASSTLIPNSCIGLPDGTHWLKLIDDNSYPLVLVECSNEFMIVDVNKEPNLKEYFSSWAMWHYAIAGPVNDNPVNWDDWYLPSKYDIPTESNNDISKTNSKTNSNSNSNSESITVESGPDFTFEGEDTDIDDSDVDTTTQYLISSDCNVCESPNEDGFIARASYMTGNLYGCFWYVRGLHDCDMDWDTYECFYCLCNSESCSAVTKSQLEGSDLTDEQKQHVSTGTCATITKKVDFQVAADHNVCFLSHYAQC